MSDSFDMPETTFTIEYNDLEYEFDFEEYAALSESDQARELQEVMTFFGATTEDDMSALYDLIAAPIADIDRALAILDGEADAIISDAQDSGDAITESSTQWYQDNVLTPLSDESATDEFSSDWGSAVSLQEDQNLDMTDGSSGTLDLDDAESGDVYYVNAVTVPEESIVSETSEADTDGDGYADVDVNVDGVINDLDMNPDYDASQTLTIPMEVDGKEVTGFDITANDGQGNITIQLTLEDGTLINIEVAGNAPVYDTISDGRLLTPGTPKIVLDGGTGNLTADFLNQELEANSTLWTSELLMRFYQSTTSTDPVSAGLDGSLMPGGDYAKYTDVAQTLYLAPSTGDFDRLMTYTYTFKDGAVPSAYITTSDGETASAPTLDGTTLTIVVTDEAGNTTTYIFENVSIADPITTPIYVNGVVVYGDGAAAPATGSGGSGDDATHHGV